MSFVVNFKNSIILFIVLVSLKMSLKLLKYAYIQINEILITKTVQNKTVSIQTQKMYVAYSL